MSGGTAAESPGAAVRRPGVPTARSVDHVAFTVPDLDEAIRFFVEVIGGEHVFTTTSAARRFPEWTPSPSR